MSAQIHPSSGRGLPFGAAAPALATLLMLSGAPVADAQTFAGSGPARPFTLPAGTKPAAIADTAPSRTEEGPRAAPKDAVQAPPPPPSAPAGDRLHRLPASAFGWRIGGETGELSWPVYLTGGEVQNAARFRLTYRTDISALPEASKVILSVNGTAIGALYGQAARSRTAAFDIPAGLLQPGFNAVALRAEQHHRVDCSLPATYELWTEVDAAETGFVLSQDSADSVVSLADLPALPVRRDGALAVRIVVDGKFQPRDLERAVRAAGAVALASRTLQPIVDFGPFSAEAGVNLVVGRTDALEAVREKLGPVRVLAPGVAFSPANADRSATLIVSGATPEAVDAAVAGLATRPAPTGAAAGRRLTAFPAGPHTAGGETIPFRALGFTSSALEGRRYAAILPLVFPADFLPGDYGKVALNLTGEYGPGLGPHAEILVRVNGRDAASWSMAKTSGAAFNGQSLGLPLGLFRPGSNRIEITALLPEAENGSACPDAAGERPRGRFVLSDGSDVRVPPLARIGRSPELASVAAGGLPAREGRTLRLVVPQPDRDSLSAAATLAAKLATVQGQVPALAFSRDGRESTPGDTLFVAPAQALDRDALARIGADGAAMERAWRARADEVARTRSDPPMTGALDDARRGGPAACSGEALRPGGSSARIRRAGPAPQEIVQDARIQPARTAAAWWSAGLKGAEGRLADLYGQAAEQAVALVRPRLPVLIAPEADDISVFAQGISGGEPFLAVAAPSSADLRLATECLVSPQTWQDVAGRAVLMRASDGALRSVAADRYEYTPTQPLAPGNLRLIAAGLMSLNPALFVMLALALAAILTVSTRVLVRNVGRRQP